MVGIQTDTQTKTTVAEDDLTEIMSLANAGEATAQVKMGDFYASGLEFPHDERVAFLWYQKAAEQSHAIACIKIGHCYADGNGVPRDKGMANFWYMKAIEAMHSTVYLDHN